jgi:hypothetical protein
VKLSRLIAKLEALKAENGDLDVIHRVGEANDPYGIVDAVVIGADIHYYDGMQPDYYVPWGDEVTNAQVVEIV